MNIDGKVIEEISSTNSVDQTLRNEDLDERKEEEKNWQQLDEGATSVIEMDDFSIKAQKEETEPDGKRSRKRLEIISSYKNIAEGLMDIALLSANSNQLRFLITYNHESSTYYISLGLVILSLTLQVAVGIGLIFKRRMQRFSRSHEFITGGVFMVTVINILLAAFTTTDNNNKS